MDAPPPPPPDDIVPKPPDIIAGRCGHHQCKEMGGHLLKCNSCKKSIHYNCYTSFVLTKWNLELLKGSAAACTKYCYRKVLKELGGSSDMEGAQTGSWDNEGVDSPSDPKTSMNILLDWWLEHGTYQCFCRKHNDDIRKMDVCRHQANKMSAETNTIHNAKNVLNKINHIKTKHLKAAAFHKTETGAGLLEDINNSGPETFKARVLDICPYYYDLLPIMGERVGSKTK